MIEYLKSTDPHAFLGMKKKSYRKTNSAVDLYAKKITIECPKCHGYGGWHLSLNAYGKGKHFDMNCGQCNGWGFVEPGLDATCIHDWHELSYIQCQEKGIRHWGSCWHVYECVKGCGKTMAQDSGD